MTILSTYCRLETGLDVEIEVAYLALMGSAAISGPNIVSLDNRVAVLVLNGVGHDGGIQRTALVVDAMCE